MHGLSQDLMVDSAPSTHVLICSAARYVFGLLSGWLIKFRRGDLV